MLGTLLLAAALATPPNPNPWELEEQEERLTIWSREVPGSDYREFRVEGVLRASSRRIAAVLLDIERHPEFMPHVIEVRRLGSFDHGHYSYVRSRPPALAQRDYAGRTVYQLDEETGVYQSETIADNRRAPPVPAGVERLSEVRSAWTLEPLPDGHTRAVYELHTNPAGLVPALLVNLGTPGSLPALFAAVESRARDPSWRPAK